MAHREGALSPRFSLLLRRWAAGAGRLAAASLLSLAAFSMAQQVPQASPANVEVAAAAYYAAADALVVALGVDLGRAPSPDDPAWHAALAAASHASALAADVQESSPAEEQVAALELTRRAYRLEAHAYGLTNWYSRAFAAWDAFLAAGGELTDSRPTLPSGAGAHLNTDRAEFHRVVSQLAFSRYEAGDPAGAQGWYLTLLDQEPDDPEALRWLARIAYERGDTAAAVVIWQRLVEVAPDDEGARFFLELSREREKYGVAASEAYRQGLRAYDAGRLDAALEAFEAAVASNPGFTNAAVWAGRTALEAERPDAAVKFWQLAVRLDPDDARSAWFLDYARVQQRWGVAAGRAYYDGLALYEDGDVAEAQKRFLAAVEAAPDFKDANVWAARTTQELDRPDEAIAYWQAVLRLDPNDDRARYFIHNARQAAQYGTDASEAFARGLAAYQAGDGDTAQAEFAAATAASPLFVQAWAYLGRVAFQKRDYVVAAEAYARALELQPDDEDYAFFAGEAARLAGVEQDAPAGAP